MKASILTAKLQQFHPDSDLMEIDVLRLFDDNTVFQEAQQRIEHVDKYSASGDLDGLREFVMSETVKLKGNLSN